MREYERQKEKGNAYSRTRSKRIGCPLVLVEGEKESRTTQMGAAE